MQKPIFSYAKLSQRRFHLYHYFIFSYIAILMVSFISSLAIYHRAYQTISDDAYLYQLTLLTQTKNTIDRFFSEIYSNLDLICANSLVDSLSSKKNFDAHDMFDVTDIRDELAALKRNNSNLNSCGVYFLQAESIITDSKRYARALIPFYLENNGLPTDLFEQMTDPVGYFLADSISGPELIFYRATFNRHYQKTAVAFICVNQSVLSQSIYANDLAQDNNIYMLDEHNIRISLAGNAPMDIRLDYNDLQNHVSNSIKDADNVTYLHEVIRSDSYPVFYGSFVAKKVFFSKLVHFSYFYIITTILIFIFGIILAKHFAKKNYEPVEHMVKLLAKSKPSSTNDKQIVNYENLERGLLDIMQESQDINFKLKHQEEQANESILAGFLRGLLPYGDGLENMIAANEHLNDIDNYYVVLFTFKDLDASPFFENQEVVKSYELIFFLFRNIINEVVLESPEGNANGLCLLVEDQLCLLLSAEFADHEQLNKKLENCIFFIRDTFSVNTIIAVSAMHTQWSEIADAYDEAMVSISHKKFWDDSIENIIFFKPTVSNAPKPDSTSLLTMIRKLTNNILVGNSNDAMENVDALCNSYFYTDIRMQFYNRCQAFMMISIIINSLSTASFDQNNDPGFTDLMNTYSKQLSKTDSLQDLKVILHEILTYIVTQKSKKDEDIPQLIEQIKAFVQNNYQNPNLNIAFISDHFDVPSARIGQQFKKAAGISLVHFIHIIRIEKAKTLLKTGITLKECTQSVGFSDVKTFIRVFKQYEGVTPGQFKS